MCGDFCGASSHMPGMVISPVSLGVVAPVLMVILDDLEFFSGGTSSLLDQNSITDTQICSVLINDDSIIISNNSRFTVDFSDWFLMIGDSDWFLMMMGHNLVVVRRSLGVNFNVLDGLWLVKRSSLFLDLSWAFFAAPHNAKTNKNSEE